MDDRGRRTAVTAALVVVAAVLVAVEAAVGGAFYNGWWVSGLATVVLFQYSGRARWAVFVAATVAVAAAFALAPLVPSWFAAAVWSVVLVTPAMVVASALERGGRVLVETPAQHKRFDAVVLSSALGAGLGILAASSLAVPLDAALRHGIVTTLLVASSLTVTVPLLFAPGSPQRLAHRRERAAIYAVSLAGIVVFLALPDSLILVFLILPALGWAAVQLPRTEAVRLLAAFSAIVYLATLVGYGPLAQPFPSLASEYRSALIFGYIAACAYVVVPTANIVERLKTSMTQERRSQATVDQLLRSTTVTAIIATDPTGLVTHLNSGAVRQLGYQPDDLVGRSPEVVFAVGEVDRHAAELGCAADFPSVILAQVAAGAGRDWCYVAKDGRCGVVHLTVNPVLDCTDGSVSGYFCIGDDVTERQRAQDALRSALERERSSVRHLLEADRVKQELVSTVSHELRTPITSIQGYSEMLADGLLGELEEPQADAVERITRSSGRLLDLVEDLLTLSRAESGELDLDLGDLDLTDVVREAVDLVGAGLKGRDLELVVDVPPGTGTLVGDGRALERVVVNLLTNAIKFTGDGGRVHVGLEDERDRVALVVRDTGIGISEEDQERLFSRFFRADSATADAIPGTGLGLSIVDAIVSAHGGTVTVASRLGEGTTFRVELPRAHAPLAVASA